MASREERVLLELISVSLFGGTLEVPADTDWDAVLQEARAQTVHGIAAQAVPAEQYGAWKNEERLVVINAAQKAYAEQALIKLFDAQGIPMVILKGSAAAMYYPKPSRRWMGDIDFIVPQERFADARALMLASGFTPRDREHMDTERELAFFKGGIEFELHRRFSDEDLDIDDCIAEGLRHVESATVDGNRVPVLPKLENGLVLLAHARHHLQIGMGLRQVIDWMMFADRVLDDSFWEESFAPAVRKTGMHTLAVVMTRMCQKYLGLRGDITWCRTADDATCDALLDCLLTSGNFGGKRGMGGRVEKIATTMRKEGLLRYLQRAGEQNWRAYQKHKWLKPLCVPYQLCRYLKQRRKSGRGNPQLREDISQSKKRYALMKQLGIV